MSFVGVYLDKSTEILGSPNLALEKLENSPCWSKTRDISDWVDPILRRCEIIPSVGGRLNEAIATHLNRNQTNSHPSNLELSHKELI